jgi:hypothetical protein
MATVKLDWTVPNVEDIQHVRVFRFTGDYAALAAADATLDLTNTDSGGNGRLLDAANAEKFVALAGSQQLAEQAYSPGAGTLEDSTATFSNTYVYGVFSHNSGGYGPGELELQTT